MAPRLHAMVTVQALGAMQRQRRAVRRQRVVRLTARDQRILEALGKLRFATTRQLARLYFGSRSGTNKRLRKLFDGRYIRAWVDGLAEDNVYSLDRRGRGLLGDVGPAPRALDGNLSHLLAINDIRIAFAVELPRLGGELLWWHSDWELRAQARARLIPDALFEIRWPTEAQVVALEVDNATRSPRMFLSKILGYASQSMVFGYRDPLLLVVGRDGRMLDRYRGTLAGRVTRAVWFTPLDQVEKLDAWLAVDGAECVSLRDLASLPYGKESL